MGGAEQVRRTLAYLVELVRPVLRPEGRALVYILAQHRRFGHLCQEPAAVRAAFEGKYDQLILVTGRRREYANPAMADVLAQHFTIVETPRPQVIQLGTMEAGLVQLPECDLYLAPAVRAYREQASAVAGGRQSPPYRLPDAARDASRQFREAHGIDPDQPFVVLHVRDAAYLPDLSYHAFRFADAATYQPAVERLLAEGYAVIRVGETESPPLPVSHPSYLEAMRVGGRDPAVEVGLMAEARFGVVSYSGPFTLLQCFERPPLVVNSVPQVSYFHVEGEVAVFKPVSRTGSDMRLSYAELIASGAMQFTLQEEFDAAGLTVGVNSAEELDGAVAEMIGRDRGTFVEDVAIQERFRAIGRGFLDSIVGAEPWRSRAQDWFALGLPPVRISQDFVSRNPGYLDPPAG